jgi:predicted nucleotide-binding protein
VEIQIKGRAIVKRHQGQHVGEMSVIDPTARRSASVVALEETCVAWVEEADFADIAASHPFLWRQLALELADRLRQRGALVRPRNERPRVFIGSSSAALPIAESIESKIKSPVTDVALWSTDVFGPSATTIESLEDLFRYADFAVLVLTGDDEIWSTKAKNARKSVILVPRDNVIFELGMSIGAIERQRTIMLVETGLLSPKIPTDLHGVTYLRFSKSGKKANQNDIDNAAREIMHRIAKMGPR